MSAVPLELRAAAGGVSLIVAWNDGSSSLLTAETLRLMCRCAECTASRALGKPVRAVAELAISRIDAIGSYAINIVFSDGHARGIYPWELLKALGNT